MVLRVFIVINKLSYEKCKELKDAGFSQGNERFIDSEGNTYTVHRSSKFMVGIKQKMSERHRCKEKFNCKDCDRGEFCCQIHHHTWYKHQLCTKCVNVTNYDLEFLDAKNHL